MTRILQTRRGTSTAHENFTGLAGEITTDLTKKTIIVHDGDTLGGHELARADLSNVSSADITSKITDCGDNSDMTSVAPEFWQELFAEYGAITQKFEVSDPCSVANTSYAEYTFDITDATAENIFADAVLICNTPECGYAISDVVPAFGIGARANPRPIAFTDANGLRVRLMVGGENFWVSHKTTGLQTAITNTNWKIKFRVWH
ncbi:MAG: hypothetical protein LBK26_00950 [Rickettsiales bacterium]|jgi:hypothetical protein|nr:hypothetical protein [Rickettsiales bacterium]